MPENDDPLLVGYHPIEEFESRAGDRSSRQILDFPGDQKPLDMSLAPSSLNFGEWKANEISTAHTAVLTNVGYEDLPIENITISGEWTMTTDCPEILKPGDTCSITAYFTPQSPGLKTGTIYVDTGDAAGAEAVQLIGNGQLLPGLLSLVPTFLSFTNVPVNTDSAVQEVILRNIGETTAPLLDLQVDGPFLLTHDCGSSLVPGGFCTLSLHMNAPTAGTQTGSVTIVHKVEPFDPVDTSLILPLFGSSLPDVVLVPATVVFSPDPVIFADTAVATPSTVRIVTMQNVGQEFLNISGFTLDSEFSQTNNCGSGLAAGGSCQIQITMVPAALGPVNGIMTATHDGEGDFVVDLSGIGISADVIAWTAPTSVILPDVLETELTTITFTIDGDETTAITLTTLPADAGGMTYRYSALPGGPFTTMTSFVLPAAGKLYVKADFTGVTVGAVTQNAVFASISPALTRTVVLTTNVIDPPIFLWADVFKNQTSFGGLDWSGAGWGTTSALPGDPALNFFMNTMLPDLAPTASILRLISPTGTLHLSRRWEMPSMRLAQNYRIDLGTTIVERSKASGSPYWGAILAWGELVANGAVPSQPAVGTSASAGALTLTLKNDADTTAFLAVVGPGSIVELRTDATAAGYHPPESRQTLYIRSVNVGTRTLTLWRPLDIAAPVNNHLGDFSGEVSDPSSLQLMVGSLLASNAARGSSTIEVQNATGFAVGDWIEMSTSETPQPAKNQFSALWLDAMLSDIAQANNPSYFGQIGMNTELNQITAISGTTFTLLQPLKKNKLTAWQGAVVKVLPIKDMTIEGGKFEGAMDTTPSGSGKTEAWEHQYIWARYCVDSVVKNGKFDTLGRPLIRRRIGQCIRFDTGWNNLATNNEIARGGSILAGEGYGISMRLGERGTTASYNHVTNCRHGVEFWSSGGDCVAEYNTLVNGTSSDIDTHGSWNVDVIIRNNNFTNDGLLRSPDLYSNYPAVTPASDGWPDAIRIGNNKFLFDDGVTVLNNTVTNYNGQAFGMVPASMNVTVDGLICDNVKRVLDLGQNSRHKKAILKNLVMRNIVADNVVHRIIHMYGDGLVPYNFDNVLLENWVVGGTGVALVVDGTSNTDPKDAATYIQRFRNLTLRNFQLLNLETPTSLAYALDIRYGATLLFDNVEIDGGLKGITLRTVTGIAGTVKITSLDSLLAFSENGVNTADTGTLTIDWVPGTTPTIDKSSPGLTVTVI